MIIKIVTGVGEEISFLGIKLKVVEPFPIALVFTLCHYLLALNLYTTLREADKVLKSEQKRRIFEEIKYKSGFTIRGLSPRVRETVNGKTRIPMRSGDPTTLVFYAPPVLLTISFIDYSHGWKVLVANLCVSASFCILNWAIGFVWVDAASELSDKGAEDASTFLKDDFKDHLLELNIVSGGEVAAATVNSPFIHMSIVFIFSYLLFFVKIIDDGFLVYIYFTFVFYVFILVAIIADVNEVIESKTNFFEDRGWLMMSLTLIYMYGLTYLVWRVVKYFV